MPDHDSSASEGFFAWLAVLRTASELGAELDLRLQDSAGLSLSRFEVLVQLERAAAAGRVLTMQVLARAVFLSKSGLTRVVAQLERDGLVVREVPADNRRTTCVTATDAGLALVRRAGAEHRAAVDALFTAHLDDAEVRAITAGLGRVLAARGHAGRPARD